ncbi:MAG: RNA polymerase sigma factor [Planctomycetota bacterium]|jgi:RNA polymerase sigma-70 factor (ECF subfamily)
MIEEKVLIWRFNRGSSDALGRIYEKYKNELLKLAVVLTNDVGAAEDAVQDVFVNFARSAGKVRTSGSLRAFLSVCVVNRIRNLRREERRRPSGSVEEFECVVSDTGRPERWVILSERLGLLSGAMAKLPEEQREVVALYMQGDVTFRQIAEVQKASVNTIQGRYRYGIDKLRKLLNSEVTE